jgi:hypothetical protein
MFVKLILDPLHSNNKIAFKPRSCNSKLKMMKKKMRKSPRFMSLLRIVNPHFLFPPKKILFSVFHRQQTFKRKSERERESMCVCVSGNVRAV